MKTLTNLYIFAEKMAINDLMNKCIDTIQDGFLEFGTVFGPGQISKIFMMSKADSVSIFPFRLIRSKPSALRKAHANIP